ncbi:MAG: undecaprenyldiphospho-muramoylpentapeptide beta-N-acetylglucosaminyltransferase [Lachnospiraceae bacterium]|nr:undecaprenyldiphospho-muramoylpentapeptide beta-N-acetylglucosaminyltransferase [Lachnospiraceae bacterium]
MKNIILTGGGTAGHVTPNIALIERLREMDYSISYIGSYDGIEKGLIEKLGIPYYGISSGKLRRYIDRKNLSDPFKVLKGIVEANRLMKQLKPDVVFSKGGYVTVPVVFAAHRFGVPTIIHESDMTPGLANKLCIPKADRICCNFAETMDYLPEGKAIHTGTPLRKELFEGDRQKGLDFCGFSGRRPVIMVVGGSTGAAAINEAVRNLLPTLLVTYDVVHICGKGKCDAGLNGTAGYKQFEYVSDELKDVFAAADLVISRAGANAVCEILALAKPNILIPLSAAASRGDQILNAESFEHQGYSFVLEEEMMTNETLRDAISTVLMNREKYIEKMKTATQADATDRILELIESYSAGKQK